MTLNASVVVPALNERENLKRLIQELKGENVNSIYVIDDMSEDGTEMLKK